MTSLEFKMMAVLKSMNINYETEYKFDTDRRWRVDFMILDVKLAIECEGGVFTRGRHTRPMGFVKDIEKYNKLLENGIALLRYSIDDFRSQGKVDKMIKQIHAVILMLEKK